MRDIGKLIACASEAMEEKLLENCDKPGWEGLTIQELIRLTDKEILELKIAVYIFEHGMCDRYTAIKEIRRESADVMNFMAMLVQKCDRIISESGSR